MTSFNEVAVSIIIPFRNAERHFRTLLESLAVQSVNDAWEVIAVDNGSTDRSRDIAEEFRPQLPLTIVDAPAKANASYARNVGVRSSSGAKLLFIDADDEVEHGYVSAMARALDSHDFVTSRVDSVSLNPPWVRQAQGPPWQANEISVFYDFLPAAGVNIGVIRHLYHSLGGFPENFEHSEDIAFSWDAQIIAHVHLHFVADAIYRYRYRDSLGELFWQSIRWGRASAQLYRHFRRAGMPARSLRHALREWSSVVTRLSRAPERASRPPLVVRLGYCVGRIQGSVRHRVVFL